MKQLDIINKRLGQKNEARECINNADEAIVEYCQVFAKRRKPLPIDSHQKVRKMVSYCLLSSCSVGTRSGNIALYKYLK